MIPAHHHDRPLSLRVRGLHRLRSKRDGSDDPHRRRPVTGFRPAPRRMTPGIFSLLLLMLLTVPIPMDEEFLPRPKDLTRLETRVKHCRFRQVILPLSVVVGRMGGRVAMLRDGGHGTRRPGAT